MVTHNYDMCLGDEYKYRDRGVYEGKTAILIGKPAVAIEKTNHYRRFVSHVS